MALVLPWLEQGLDRDLYQLDYRCMQAALVDRGYAVRLVDPLDSRSLREVLAAPEFPLILTVRSQAKDWPVPVSGTAEFQAIRDKTLVTLIGNPPYYDGSTGFHDSVFRRKLAMLMDHDTLDYAHGVNRSGARLLPYRPAFNDIGLEDEAQWLPTSRRPVPILFVGTCDDPERFREAWRALFDRFPQVVRSIEGAAELLGATCALPVVRALERTTADLGLDLDLRSRAGRLALTLLTRFTTSQARRRLLARLAGYPSLIVTAGAVDLQKRHADCVVAGPMAFAGILDLMKRTRCLIALNPNSMTGAISERVTNAMRRGAVVVNAPNSAMQRYDGTSVGLLGPSMEGLTDWLDAATAGDPVLDDLGEAAVRVAGAEFRMDDAIDAILRHASDPATWDQPQAARVVS
ncbi:hypothetical protein GCM10017083_38250 [Thalassobaculum fulvum]|uniref:Uncharacterized protein n=1 Tax=Thalassobaculum fulvum TaxID=1633335 RepID=A0A918XVZ2_9PROT|nr:hypothetical protein [Thalassobaculum fulvum]GHD57161.1 hypothetical protein GCM10017083_38250 [Thalassobaculum fulvum]